jgi:hypothetical protein
MRFWRVILLTDAIDKKHMKTIADLSQRKKKKRAVMEVGRKAVVKSAQTIFHHQPPFHLMLILLIKLITLVIAHALTLVTSQIKIIMLRIIITVITILLVAVVEVVEVVMHRAQMILAVATM